MAGQIKVDSINADSNLALKIANTAVAFIDSSGLRPISGNVNLDATATSKLYLPSANTVAIQTAGVTGLSISSSQVVTLANALAVTSGGTGVTTSTGTGAVVLGTSPSISGAVMTTMASSVITSGTAVASTSGTSIDFTSIPSWVKRITVMIAGMSTNGASEYVLRIGDSATISATGYVGAYATNAVAAASTTGFGFGNGSSATATIVSGSFVLTTLDVATFKWTCIGMLGESDTVRMTYSAGSKTLAGALTNVRVTTLNGTDTFDAGSINILYE